MAERKDGALLLVTGIASTALGVALAELFKKVPATPDEKLDHIINLLEMLTAELGTMVDLETKILAAQAGIAVTVETPWVAREPETIFEQAVRAAMTFNADRMVNWTHGKRMVIKVESSLDQIVQIQAVGNDTDSYNLATDINGPWPCPPNGNISIGMAWDDWHPFVGVRVVVAIAPTVGRLTIRVIVQE